MERIKLRMMVALIIAGAPLCASGQMPANDPYVPLRLYEGKWELATSGAKKGDVMHIDNHCAKTGLFFVCEQMINGKSEDLVVFLPGTSEGATQIYRTQALSTAAKKPNDWNRLEISGDHWTYSSEEVEGDSKTYWRTTNVFSGPNKIHFEVQRSSDGKTWQTQQSGDELRAK